MKAIGTIESNRLLSAVKRLKLSFDAPVTIISEPICCTLKVTDTHCYNYESARIESPYFTGACHFILIDDGQKVHVRQGLVREPGILRKISFKELSERLASVSQINQ